MHAFDVLNVVTTIFVMEDESEEFAKAIVSSIKNRLSHVKKLPNKYKNLESLENIHSEEQLSSKCYIRITTDMYTVYLTDVYCLLK